VIAQSAQHETVEITLRGCQAAAAWALALNFKSIFNLKMR
jgi:hypothetical protein